MSAICKYGKHFKCHIFLSENLSVLRQKNKNEPGDDGRCKKDRFSQHRTLQKPLIF